MNEKLIALADGCVTAVKTTGDIKDLRTVFRKHIQAAYNLGAGVNDDQKIAPRDAPKPAPVAQPKPIGQVTGPAPAAAPAKEPAKQADPKPAAKKGVGGGEF